MIGLQKVTFFLGISRRPNNSEEREKKPRKMEKLESLNFVVFREILLVMVSKLNKCFGHHLSLARHRRI